MGEQFGDHPGVMRVEPAWHTLAEITDLDPQLAFGHRGQHLRVAFTGAQPVEDHPAGHAQHCDTTEDSLTLASSSTFCSRWTSRERSSVS